VAILDLMVTGGAIEVAIGAAVAIAVAIVVAIAREREGEGMNDKVSLGKEELVLRRYSM